MYYYTSINWAAVITAAIAAFAFGSIWYGPLFGKQWMKMMGFTPASMKKMKVTPARAMALGFLTTLVTAIVLAVFISLLAYSNQAKAVKIGILLWLGFLAPMLLASYLWEGKSFNLFSFNAFYRLAEVILMAAIIGAWP